MSKSKRQQVRERQRRQKLRNNLIWSAVGIGVIVIVGILFWQGNSQSSPRSSASEPIGEVVEIPADAGGHINDGENPGPFPSNPPAGGKHYAGEFDAGFYDENSPEAQVVYPEGYIGHNLEHGYVVFWYSCATLSESECDTLKSEIRSVMNDFGGTKLIAFPWPSLDIPMAMTSWGRLQRFDSFDAQLATAFIEANLNQAPEPNAP